MMKRIVFAVLALFMLAYIPLCVSASDDAAFLIDEADLLTDSQETALVEKCAEISKKHNAQIAVVTVSSLEGGDIDEFVEFLYDENGYGYGKNHDGVLILVSMDPREFRILSNGLAGDAITLDYIDVITEEITPYLSDGDYAQAFGKYVDLCDYYINGHINGFPFNWGKNLCIALVVGLVVALIVTSVLKGQLKSVRKQERANAYVKAGSLNITRSHDFFLYSTVARTERPQEKSSNSGGSGSSRNVGGGSF